jgi:hypothetical protein
MAQAPVSRYESAPGYTVCRTPARPDYLFGNYLILDQPPDPASLPDWLERARSAFGAESEAVLQWEQPGRYPWRELPDGTLIEHLVLAGRHFTRQPPASTRLIEVVSDVQWEELVRFATRETATGEAWTRWRYAQYRALGQAARWLVAIEDGLIVAAGGIVSAERLDRFQEVVTAADRRRHGLASTVCGALLLRTRRPGRLAVAVADPATGADGVYRGLGLRPVGYQYTILAPGVPTRSRCDA